MLCDVGQGGFFQDICRLPTDPYECLHSCDGGIKCGPFCRVSWKELLFAGFINLVNPHQQPCNYGALARRQAPLLTRSEALRSETAARFKRTQLGPP